MAVIMARSLKLNQYENTSYIFIKYNWSIIRAAVIVLFSKRCYDVVCVDHMMDHHKKNEQ
jgi:hypothetical protein